MTSVEYFIAKMETDLSEWLSTTAPYGGSITRNTTEPLVGVGDLKISWGAYPGNDGYCVSPYSVVLNDDFWTQFAHKFDLANANNGPLKACQVYHVTPSTQSYVEIDIKEGSGANLDKWRVEVRIMAYGGVQAYLFSAYLTSWPDGVWINVRYNQPGNTAELWMNEALVDSASGLSLMSSDPVYVRVGHYLGYGSGPGVNTDWYFDDCIVSDYRVPNPLIGITPPTCQTDPAAEVTTRTATLHGTCTDDGGEPCQYRFQYGKTDAYGSDTSWTGAVVTDDPFEEAIADLDPNTTYHFRSQVKNSAT